MTTLEQPPQPEQVVQPALEVVEARLVANGFHRYNTETMRRAHHKDHLYDDLSGVYTPIGARIHRIGEIIRARLHLTGPLR
jgi:hypothetical protein